MNIYSVNNKMNSWVALINEKVIVLNESDAMELSNKIINVEDSPFYQVRIVAPMACDKNHINDINISDVNADISYIEEAYAKQQEIRDNVVVDSGKGYDYFGNKM